MPYVLVRHRVKNYAVWKTAFDEHGNAREEAGSRGGFLFRIAGDANDVLVLLEWETLEKARAFLRSEGLKKVMDRAGVVGSPEILYLDGTGRPPA